MTNSWTNDNIPDHLNEGVRIEEADFIFDGFTQQEASKIFQAVTDLTSELNIQQHPNETRYFVLGSYDKYKKPWLKRAQELLMTINTACSAILLDQLDEENLNWENFYIKFRYVLEMTDFCVMVAEDNDGGHELELGEIPLAETFVLKRDYSGSSIDNDLEKRMFDSMIRGVFEVLERNGHLFHWSDKYSFAQGVVNVVKNTR